MATQYYYNLHMSRAIAISAEGDYYQLRLSTLLCGRGMFGVTWVRFKANPRQPIDTRSLVPLQITEFTYRIGEHSLFRLDNTVPNPKWETITDTGVWVSAIAYSCAVAIQDNDMYATLPTLPAKTPKGAN